MESEGRQVTSKSAHTHTSPALSMKNLSPTSPLRMIMSFLWYSITYSSTVSKSKCRDGSGEREAWRARGVGCLLLLWRTYLHCLGNLVELRVAE